jgi:hypothetical protein
MTNRILELQVELLVLQHGRRSVVEAIAGTGGRPAEEIERDIASIQRRKVVKRRKEVNSEETLLREFRGRPDLLPLIRRLLQSYENRIFLPNLRDVQRFVERSGGLKSRLKSRQLAIVPLIRTLAGLTDTEIERIVHDLSAAGSNDYELLAREIMGKK